MAKKIARKSEQPKQPEKARYELRIDEDLLNKIKAIAEAADISVNQLICGLLEWASRDPHLGEPDKQDDGSFKVRPQAGCVFWGELGGPLKLTYVGGELDRARADAMRRQYEDEREDFWRSFNGNQDEYDEYCPRPPKEYELLWQERPQPGRVFCSLDFTVRRVVRDDH